MHAGHETLKTYLVVSGRLELVVSNFFWDALADAKHRRCHTHLGGIPAAVVVVGHACVTDPFQLGKLVGRWYVAVRECGELERVAVVLMWIATVVREVQHALQLQAHFLSGWRRLVIGGLLGTTSGGSFCAFLHFQS